MKTETFEFISKLLADDAMATGVIKDLVGVIEVWEDLQNGKQRLSEDVDRAFQTAFYGATTNSFAAAFGGMFKPLVLEVMNESAKAAKDRLSYNASHTFMIKAVPAAAINLKGTPITDYGNIATRMKEHLRSLNA
jgi:DNA-binding FadR family transcriptional regulator